MLIKLDEELVRAARDDHDPSRLDAAGIAQELRAARVRLVRWCAIAALALALVIGFIAWYQPRLGPAPTPSPTPTPAYVWDDSMPTGRPLSDEEVARRCPAPAGMEIDPLAPQDLSVGGAVAFTPAGSTPSPNADGVDDRQMEFCRLGYQHTPDTTPLTPEDLTATPATVLGPGARKVGFDLGRAWHPVNLAVPQTLGYTTVVMTTAWTDSGWHLTCGLSVDGAGITFDNIRSELGQPCTKLSLTVADATGTSADPLAPARITSLGLEAFAPIATADGRRVDQDVTTVDAHIGAPLNHDLKGIKAVDGFCGVFRTIPVTVPLTQPDLDNIPITYTFHSRSGSTRTCKA